MEFYELLKLSTRISSSRLNRCCIQIVLKIENKGIFKVREDNMSAGSGGRVWGL